MLNQNPTIMDNQQILTPSPDFQRNLSAFEESAQQGLVKRPPVWLQMASGLSLAYRTLEPMGTLGIMFDQTNEFDMALLRWCLEAEIRTIQPANRRVARVWPVRPLDVNGDQHHLPNPSADFQHAFSIFELTLETNLENTTLEEWMRLAGALAYSYRILRRSNTLGLMFDVNNVFDFALLRWCVEADDRAFKRITNSGNLPQN